MFSNPPHARPYEGRQLDNFSGAESTQHRGHANFTAKPARLESVIQNPFLSSDDALRRSRTSLPQSKGMFPGAHHNDPFVSHAGKVGNSDHSQRTRYGSLPAGGARKFFTPGKLIDNAPFFTYLWVVALWYYLRHYLPAIVEMFTLFAAILSTLCVVIGLKGYPSRGVPMTILGLSSLVAVGFGHVVGWYGWTHYMRQYWFMRTGPTYLDTFASLPAAALADASVLRFADSSSQKDDVRGLPAMVDHLKSVGYRNSSMFCAAPILDASTMQAPVVRVEYWAVGVDCCQSNGHFECHDSREYIPGGGYGVVNLDDAQSPMIKAAISKAESAHNLVSAPGALLVRYVRDPEVFQHTLAIRAFRLFCFSSVFAFILLRSVDHLLWSNGLESWTVAQRMNQRPL